MEAQIHGKTLELVQGDIVKQNDIDAVVNAANAELRIGGGVAGAIHNAAGPDLEKECRQYAPIKPGQAVITNAFNLPNKKIIHCLGPVYGVDKNEAQKLAECYQNGLAIADKEGLLSIAFPAISTGAFGYPLEEAAKIAISTVKNTLPACKSLQKVRFVFFSAKDLKVHEEIWENLKNE